jgi:hypothetical protein
MEITKKIGDDTFVKFTAETPRQIFETLASLEVLTVPACGLCCSTNTIRQVRHVEKFVYLEYRCCNCHATLPIGLNADGSGLFVKATSVWSIYGTKQMKLAN